MVKCNKIVNNCYWLPIQIGSHFFNKPIKVMKYIKAFVLISILFLFTNSLFSENNEKRNIINFIENIKTQFPNDIDLNLSSQIFFISKYEFFTCVSDRINVFSFHSDDKNNIVVVRHLEKGEENFLKTIKEVLKADIVLSDVDYSICELLNVNLNCMFLVNNKGEIIGKDEHLTGVMTPAENLNLEKKRYLNKVKLDESYVSLVSPDKVVFDKKYNRILVFDNKQNHIFAFNLFDGRLISDISISDRLKNYYIDTELKNLDDSNIYKLSGQNILKYVYYAAINDLDFDYSKNIPYANCRLVNKFEYTNNFNTETKDSSVGLDYSSINVFINIKNDSLSDVNEIYQPAIELNSNYIPYKDKYLFEVLESEKENPDSNFLFVLVDNKKKTSKNLMSYSELKSSTGIGFKRTRYANFFFSANDENFFYLNPDNQIFIHFTLKNDKIETIRKITEISKINDVFENIIASRKADSIFNKKFVLPVKNLINEVFIDNDKIYVYVIKKHNYRNDIIEAYLLTFNAKGEFLKEQKIDWFTNKFDLLNSHLIGIKDKSVFFLNKWKEFRWEIEEQELK